MQTISFSFLLSLWAYSYWFYSIVICLIYLMVWFLPSNKLVSWPLTHKSLMFKSVNRQQSLSVRHIHLPLNLYILIIITWCSLITMIQQRVVVSSLHSKASVTIKAMLIMKVVTKTPHASRYVLDSTLCIKRSCNYQRFYAKCSW